jgi:hypothetical protein
MTVAGEQSCRECGARLAADQRYCLECGSRRGDSRIDFRAHLDARGDAPSQAGAANGSAATADGAQPSPPAPVVPEEQRPQRDYTPLAAAGGITVLGLMLLVGVLIGRGNGEQASAPPPQVVRVGAAGGETAATANAKAPKDGAKKTGGKGTGKDGALTGGGKPAPPAITASESELEALQEKSPQEYSEASAKLPDEIATPGTPPPTDGKKPGGGSSGTTIE